MLNRAEARTIWTQLIEGAGHHVLKAGINVEGQVYDHLKGYSGEGFGGWLAVILWFFISPVVMFTLLTTDPFLSTKLEDKASPPALRLAGRLLRVVERIGIGVFVVLLRHRAFLRH